MMCQPSGPHVLLFIIVCKIITNMKLGIKHFCEVGPRQAFLLDVNDFKKFDPYKLNI